MFEAKPLAFRTICGSKLSTVTSALLSNPAEYRRVVVHCNIAPFYVQILHMLSTNSTNLCTHRGNLVGWQLKNSKISEGNYYFWTILHPFRFEMKCLCDGDWAQNPENKRSTSGYGIFRGQLFSWTAKNQNVVSR